MKIIFAGTPEFAAHQLQTILAAGFSVDCVLTQPDKPRGRGQRLSPSPVKQIANQHHLPVLQPKTLKDQEIQQQLSALAPDLIIVSAYGMLLPQAVLDIPKQGCWNVHASLLPRWRGAAPIQYALLHGDKQTGISLMQMEAGLDSGPVLLQQAIDIEPTDTSASLFEKLTKLGAKVLLDGLRSWQNLNAKPQDESAVRLSPKIDKAQGHIDWTQPAAVIERKLRAFDPAPGCYSHYQEQRIKIFKGTILTTTDQSLPPGVIQHISKQGIDVSTGQGLLQLNTVQLAGKPRQSVNDILNARADFFSLGDTFL